MSRATGWFRTGSNTAVRISLAPALAVLLSCAGSSILPGQVRAAPVEAGRKEPEVVLQTGHTARIKAVAFSPDGRWLASAGDDKTVRLWDRESGRLWRVLDGHEDPVSGIAFSPDGASIAAGGSGIKVWSVATGRQIAALSTGPVTAFASVPGGRSFVFANLADTVRLWDPVAGGEPRVLSRVGGVPRSLSASSTGHLLAIAVDRRIELLDIATGRQVRVLSGHGEIVNSVQFSPDGRFLASAADERTVRLWEVATGKELTAFDHDNYVQTLTFNPDGSVLATGSLSALKLWNVKTGRIVRSLASPHSNPVTAVAFTPDGHWLASGDAFHSLTLWDVEIGRPIRIVSEDSNAIKALALSRNGRFLALAKVADGDVKLFDLGAGRESRRLGDHHLGAGALAFSPDGRLLATVSTDNEVNLWDTASGRQFRKFPDALGYGAVAFSPDGRLLASASKEKTLKIFDTATGSEVRTLAGLGDYIDDLVFLRDGRTLVAASDGALAMWDTATGREVPMPPGSKPAAAPVALSPDGRWLAYSQAGRRLVLWDVTGGREGRAIDAGASINAVTFSPDNRWVASAQDDHTVRIWDAATGRELKTIGGFSAKVNSIAFTSGALAIVTGSTDGVIRFCRPSDGTVLAEFTAMTGTDDWAVASPQGLFDGRREALDRLIAFRTANATWPAGPFHACCWIPGLLSKAAAGAFPRPRSDPAAVALTAAPSPPAGGLPDAKQSSTGAYVPMSNPGKAEPPLPTASQENAGRPELLLQTGHAGRVNAVRFSPDGRWLASAGDDHTVRLWDLTYGREVRSAAGHTGRVMGVAFSPDGRMLASASQDGTVKLLEMPALREIRTFTTTPSQSNAIAFSPNGRLLASGGYGDDIQVWDVAAGRLLRVLPWPDGHFDDSVYSLSFGPDSRKLFAGFGKVSRVWDASTGKLLSTWRQEFGENNVAVSPDGRLLAAYGDRKIRVLDASTGQVVRTLTGHEGVVVSVEFSPDGKRIASGGWDKTVRLWDVSSGREVLKFSGENHNVNSVSFRRDGRYLVSGGEDNNIRIWDAANGREVETLSGRAAPVNSTAWSPDGRWLAVASSDGPLKIWDLRAGTVRSFTGHISWVEAVVFSPDGRYLASRGDDLTIRIWDVASGAVLQTLHPHSLKGDVGLAFSPDGGKLATGSDKSVILWDIASGRELPALTGALGDVEVVAFSPDGRRLASGDDDATARIWDLATGRELLNWRGHRKSIHGVLFSRDGLRVLTASLDGTIKIWQADSGRELQTLTADTTSGTPAVYGLAQSADGTLLASAGGNHLVKLWDAASGRELRSLAGHRDIVTGVAFSPDGRWLASAGQDGSARIWDTASGSERLTLVSFHEGGTWLAVAPDGLFDGMADAMRQAAWRIGNSNETSALDAFFTDFYHPGLVPETIAGSQPKAQVDVATALQVPGLRLMLAANLAHLETRQGRVVVCFEQKPGAVVNTGPGDQRAFFPPVHGYGPGTTPGCKFEKPLASAEPSAAEPIERLQNWKAEAVTTPWDGRPSDTARSTLHVLTVAVGQYPATSGFDPLPYAVPSARAIAAFFREQQSAGQKPYARVRVWDGLYDADATRLKLRQRLAEMAQEVKDDDVVLLYLAGHGKVALGEEMFYFVPVDGQDDDLSSTAVSTAVIADALRNIPARRVVLLVDACQSGAAIEPLNKIATVKARAGQRLVRPGQEPASPETGVGVHLIAATLPLSYAVGQAAGESVLTETVLQFLRQPAGVVTIGQLDAYVREKLPGISNQVTHGFQQVPLVNAIGLDFPLAGR